MRDTDGFNRALRGWAVAGGRRLEVREARTAWAVLVAEVMSQQTQIERVGEPWRRFVERWPGPAELARAGTADLLRAWAGLGYNRRALALREAARHIVDRHGGDIPRGVAELEALPGIGPYTARATAAAAFGTPVAPLDVNVRRVLERLGGRRISGHVGQAGADLLVDRDDPRAWVNAVMDLAAAVCLPARPDCGACPVARWCASRGIAPPARASGRAPAGAGGAGPGRASVERTPGAPVARPPQLRFPATRRWLRGRLVVRLRDADPGTWVRFDAPVGLHSLEAVQGALAALEREGFIARRGDEARLA